MSERFIPLLLLLLGLGSQALRAERPARLDVADLSPPNFRVFTSNDGLSDEIWSTVGFGRDGYVWGGSASSLARFDGYRWTMWNFAPRSLVRDMATSPDGMLWAIFEGDGLARYDGRRWQLDHGIEGFIHRFSDVDRGAGAGRSLWAAAANGFYVWQDGRWRADPGNAWLPPGQPVRIEATEQPLVRQRQRRHPSQAGRSLAAVPGRGCTLAVDCHQAHRADRCPGTFLAVGRYRPGPRAL